MTAEEWKVNEDYKVMFTAIDPRFFIQNGALSIKINSSCSPVLSDRKLKLFLCGCCRQISSDISSDIEIVEEFIDGRLGRKDVYKKTTLDFRRDLFSFLTGSSVECAVSSMLYYLGKCDPSLPENIKIHFAEVEDKAIAQVLREVYNPFCNFKPEYITSDVDCIAKDIYFNRKWYGLPILADALEDSGCNESVILEHLRSNSNHMRGCWALDIVLGKEKCQLTKIK
jgi:hypothetical protein